MSTIREIARELNLSHTTVSRVLNTRDLHTISPATQERVWETARVMGYRPHAAARALATGRTQQIALLMRYLFTSFHAQVVSEVERALRQSGYQVMIATAESREGPTEGVANALSQWQVDGYLAFETAARVRALLPVGQTGKTPPLVAMGGHDLGDVPDRVSYDLAAGADAAMGHLFSLGFRRIGYVAPDRDDPRRVHYYQKMEEAGLAPERIVTRSQHRGEVREAIYRHVQEGKPLPQALFCFNDEVAIGAYRGLRDAGRRIPEDVALVGFDGIEDVAYLDTPITTVALPIAEMCHRGWDLLLRRLRDPEAEPSRVMLQPTLIVRESTGGSSTTVTNR